MSQQKIDLHTRTHLRGRLNHFEALHDKAVYKFYIHKVTVGSLTPATSAAVWWLQRDTSGLLWGIASVFGRGHWKSWWGQAPSSCTQLRHENCRQLCACSFSL